VIAGRLPRGSSAASGTSGATGITTYLQNGGAIEHTQQIANHESPRTTVLYDCTNDAISLDERACPAVPPAPAMPVGPGGIERIQVGFRRRLQSVDRHCAATYNLWKAASRWAGQYCVESSWHDSSESAGGGMTATVAQMTKGELREMIEASVERKLLELLGDPDEGLLIRKAVRDRLLRQQQAISAGERGEPLEDVVRRVGLE
jgi:hypothetical protein